MIDRLAKAAEEAAKKGGGYFYEAVADDGELILGVDGPVDMREVVRAVLGELTKGTAEQVAKEGGSVTSDVVWAIATNIDTILNEKTDADG